MIRKFKTSIYTPENGKPCFIEVYALYTVFQESDKQNVFSNQDTW